MAGAARSIGLSRGCGVFLEWELAGRKQSHWLRPGELATVGRGTDCTMSLPHPTVSRRHAEIRAVAGGYQIRNLSATNPIAIEYQGRSARLDVNEWGALPAGATLHFGEVRVAARAATALRVRCPGPCGRVVEVPTSGFCPHCGTALASAETFSG